MKDLAKGLAGLGRNGDSMLVHMQPGEVAGLQALAESQGTSLTINPDTGLPEAFNLGRAFSSLLPTIVGAALAPSTGGASLFGTGMFASAAPILGGALTGAALASSQGEDPLMGALTGGFGGYGGSQLGSSLAKMGAGQTAASTQAAEIGSALNVPTDTAANIAKYGTMTADQASTLGNVAQYGAMTAPATPTIPQGLQNMATGAKNLVGMGDMSMGDAYNAFTQAGGSGMQLGMPLATAALGGLEPSDLYGNPIKPKEDKYDPYATLNLSGNTGLKLYADGGSVQSGGLRDLYGTSDNANIGAISQDGYGLGRLNNLVNQTDLTRAQDYAYADGGDVSLNLNTGKRGSTSEEPSRFSDSRLPALAMASMGRSMADLNAAIPPHAGGILGAMYPQGNDIYRNLVAQRGEVDLPPLAAALMYNANPSSRRGAEQSGTPITSLNLNSGQQETRYIAKGGYLDGAGDGMSDSIPASIEGRQPARLADGEFVVPADVVSHIGNGSSKAGAKRLYAMLDRVREARTGTKKQGREINPKKYMPA